MILDYFKSNLLLIIEEMNINLKKYSNEDLKHFADNLFTEADLQARIWYPYRNFAHLNMQGNPKDIHIPSKDFILEVKYLRNFSSAYNSKSNKATWHNAFEKDYNWLINEIKNGKKNKRAFILGWINIDGRNFNNLMQLGIGSGQSPSINKERIILFPFLNYNPNNNRTNSIFYSYMQNNKINSITIPGYGNETVNCLFLGKPQDKFHIAVYF
ncbi:hypothetical protein [Clostridium tertium]|uniref:hypothetical protein n=1 Tax=Clostridium tertium TaxID=1559 RepID=UPI002028A3C0|nr:hypothetical protein [Clostridium tertium]